MLAQYLELLPSDRDENNNICIEVSNYDYCLVQPIGGEIDLTSTIDSGAIQSVSDGSAISAQNFVPSAALLINDGTTMTTTISTGEIGRLAVVGRFVRIKMGNAVEKTFVMLSKIS